MAEKKKAKTKRPRPGLPTLSIQNYQPNQEAINQALWGPEGKPPQQLPPKK